MKEENLQEDGFRSGFVSIIGRPNMGKSTLLNRILGQKIAITSRKPQTTRNRILGIHNQPGAQILFLDTPGIHNARGGLNSYMVEQAVTCCSGVDLILLLIEAEALGKPEKEAHILKILARSNTPVVLGINKVDLVARACLLPQIERFSSIFDFSEIIPFSAMTGEGVERLVEVVRNYLPTGPAYYPEDMVTDQPERFIVAEMVREQVLKRIHKEIPYGVAVVVESFEERSEKNLVVVKAAVHVEREPHKKIVLGKQGSVIKEIGRYARLDMERMLGSRVFLELFVKVTPGWTESTRRMREFGYE